MKGKNINNYTRLAYLQFIKIIINNNKIINQNLTYEEIISLIKEYYKIKKLDEPKITKQSISNLKNRKLILKPLIRNKITESFALFIKSKFNEFNIDLFFNIKEYPHPNKQDPIIKSENKFKFKIILLNIFIFFVFGIGIFAYINNEENENLFIEDIEIEPTVLEKNPEDYVEISNLPSKNKSIFDIFFGYAHDKSLSIKPDTFDQKYIENIKKKFDKPSASEEYFIDDLGIKWGSEHNTSMEQSEVSNSPIPDSQNNSNKMNLIQKINSIGGVSPDTMHIRTAWFHEKARFANTNIENNNDVD